MFAYSPFLGQTPVPSDAILNQLIGLQQEIGALIDGIPKGSVNQTKIEALKKRLDQCQTQGPTSEAVRCLSDVKTDLQAISERQSTGTPWGLILTGVAVAGMSVYLLLAK